MKDIKNMEELLRDVFAIEGLKDPRKYDFEEDISDIELSEDELFFVTAAAKHEEIVVEDDE